MEPGRSSARNAPHLWLGRFRLPRNSVLRTSFGRTAAPVGERRFSSPQSDTPQHLAEKILTFETALVGERKLITILFADLKGSDRPRPRGSAQASATSRVGDIRVFARKGANDLIGTAAPLSERQSFSQRSPAGSCYTAGPGGRPR